VSARRAQRAALAVAGTPSGGEGAGGVGRRPTSGASYKPATRGQESRHRSACRKWVGGRCAHAAPEGERRQWQGRLAEGAGPPGVVVVVAPALVRGVPQQAAGAGTRWGRRQQHGEGIRVAGPSSPCGPVSEM
jgi:hypothetical protein